MDVVWCHFPYDERRGVPAIDPHPGLVFATNEFRPGEFAVQVAFGTSNVTRGDRAQHFVVSNYNALQFAGLNKETFFDLGRYKWLPWTTDFFRSPDPDKYATPVIGQILGEGQVNLRYVLEQRRAAGLATPC